MTEIERETLNVAEAAALMGIGKSSVYALIHSETSGFPYLQIGRKIVIPKTSLRNWMNTEAVRGACYDE